MPKYWSYEKLTHVTINNNAHNGMPGDVGKKGVILDQLNNKLYDYYVKLDDGMFGKFRECELDLINT